MPPGVSRRHGRERARGRWREPADGGGSGSRPDRSVDRTRRRAGEDRRRMWVHRGARGSRSVRTGRGGRHAGARRRRPDPRVVRSGRQLAPALAASCLEDRTTGAIRHAVPEAVPAGPTSVVGLERALHGMASSVPMGRTTGGPRVQGGQRATIVSDVPSPELLDRSRETSRRGRAWTGTGTRRSTSVEPRGARSNCTRRPLRGHGPPARTGRGSIAAHATALSESPPERHPCSSEALTCTDERSIVHSCTAVETGARLPPHAGSPLSAHTTRADRRSSSGQQPLGAPAGLSVAFSTAVDRVVDVESWRHRTGA